MRDNGGFHATRAFSEGLCLSAVHDSFFGPPSQVVASLNILMSGFAPESPILDAEGSCQSLDPDVSETPICCLRSGNRTAPLTACITELRGDWKFLKAFWQAIDQGMGLGFKAQWLAIAQVTHVMTLMRFLGKEWLQLRTGWSSNHLCYHCTATSGDFLTVPYSRDKNPRRCMHGPNGFLQCCLKNPEQPSHEAEIRV